MEGKDLRARRRQLGMTQKQFADVIGVSSNFVAMMERGERPIGERTALIVAGLRRRPLIRPATTTDPMEREIEEALIFAGVPYQLEHEMPDGHKLDFHLPDHDVAIEVKRFHTPRLADQMARYPNVIAVQGDKAVRAMANLIRHGAFPPAAVARTGSGSDGRDQVSPALK